MNILWIKDNNAGHEKQVKALLDELLKTQEMFIDERLVKGFFPFFRYIDKISENYYDIIIGAGHNTYSFLLDIKKSQKPQTKSIAILTPSFNKSNFDIICAPSHDKNKFKDFSNVIMYEGSLAKVSLKEPDQNIISIAVGGKNKHYEFNINYILSQINYFLSLHPYKKCYIFNSRRTPTSMNDALISITSKDKNIIFCDIKNNTVNFIDILHASSAKLITRDSVNMIYESLSCKGNTYLIDMKCIKTNNKVVKLVNELISNKNVGYIDHGNIIEGISKMQLNKQNIHNDVFAEVEKVSYQLRKIL